MQYSYCPSKASLQKKLFMLGSKICRKIPQILHAYYDNPVEIDGLVWSANDEKS